MTAKQFDKAVGTLSGKGILDKILIAAMGMCLILSAPFAFVNYGILSVSWFLFSMLYIFWEIYRILYDPAYPIVYNVKKQEDKLYIPENRRTVYAAAVFPADRKTAVRASNNTRLIVSLIIVLGLAAQGISLIKTDKLICASPLVISPCLITFIYNISSILTASHKGIHSFGTRQMCTMLITSVSFSGLTMLRNEPDDRGEGAGIIMLLNAFITLAVSLICYVKCLKDAENTAHNGEKIGEIEL